MSTNDSDVTFIVRKLEAALARVALLTHRRPLLSLLAVLLVTAGAGQLARRLSIDADMINLLPPSFESIRDLEALKERFGGVGYVVVVGHGAEPEALERFADDVAPKLEALEAVRYVDFKRPSQWFKDRALYYMSTEDLEVLQERIEDRANYERAKANPLLAQLDDEGPPSLDFSDLEAKYRGGAERKTIDQLDTSDDYYIDREAKMIALLVKPAFLATDLTFAKKVVGEVEGALAQVDLARYPGLTVELTGRYKKKIDQQAAIEGDLGVTSALALALMLLYLVIHFRRLAAVGLIVMPLLFGLVWTFGLAAVVFERLNILTGFVGAILLGLGIDHGIHLLGRYQSERADDVDQQEALRRTFANTGRAVVLAAVTTFVGFAGLSFTEFRAFREFGQMTAWGTAFIVLAYAVVLPALLGLAGKTRWRISRHGPSRLIQGYARVVPRWAPSIFWLITVAGLFLTFFVPRLQFDYDFAGLDGGDIRSYQLDKEVNRLLGRSQTPVVLITDRADQEQAAADALRARAVALGAGSKVDFVASSADLVPTGQSEKQEVLQSVRGTLESFDPERLTPDDRARYDSFLTQVKAQPFGLDDLPIEVRRQFSADGRRPEGGLVLIFPSISISDGEQVVELAKEVRGVPLPDGSTVSAAGEAIVLADVLGLVFSESPVVVAVTLVLVFLSLWLLLGRLGTALLCFLPAPLTVLWSLGLAYVTGLELNYLNMVVIPVLFGISVDAGVHLVVRGAESREHLAEAMTDVGRAIVGATLTTAFGFGSLILAHHPGLNSFGRLALLGLGANVVAAMLWLTSLLALFHIRAARQTDVGLRGAFTGRLAADIGTVFGAGYSPKAPGTFGAWAALPFGYLLGQVDLPLRLAIVAVLIAVSFPVATRYMKGKMSALDPQEIVYDEFIGVLIPIAVVPATWPWILAAFALFRLLDITKPGPVGWVDKNMKSPAGVMLDDVVAGLLAALVLGPAAAFM
ncbi:MAG: phosphatidylglycerophosphatase A [Deltaproteobacteria bacterium]|nr:phosphatidylglycerophosphatase A [Deltaproteobacteria bacterium]